MLSGEHFPDSPQKASNTALTQPSRCHSDPLPIQYPTTACQDTLTTPEQLFPPSYEASKSPEADKLGSSSFTTGQSPHIDLSSTSRNHSGRSHTGVTSPPNQATCDSPVPTITPKSTISSSPCIADTQPSTRFICKKPACPRRLKPFQNFNDRQRHWDSIHGDLIFTCGCKKKSSRRDNHKRRVNSCR